MKISYRGQLKKKYLKRLGVGASDDNKYNKSETTASESLGSPREVSHLQLPGPSGDLIKSVFVWMELVVFIQESTLCHTM